MMRASLDATKRKKVIDDNSDDEIDERLFAEHRNANANNASENIAIDANTHDDEEATNQVDVDNNNNDNDDDDDLDIDDKIVDRPRRRLHRKDSKKAAALSSANATNATNIVNNNNNNNNELNNGVRLVVESARSEADLQAAHADFESVLRLYYRMQIVWFLFWC